MLNPQTLARIKRAHAESALQYPSKEYPYLVVRCYRDTMEPFELVTKARTYQDAVASIESRIIARKRMIADYNIIHEGQRIGFVLFAKKVG